MGFQGLGFDFDKILGFRNFDFLENFKIPQNQKFEFGKYFKSLKKYFKFPNILNFSANISTEIKCFNLFQQNILKFVSPPAAAREEAEGRGRSTGCTYEILTMEITM